MTSTTFDDKCSWVQPEGTSPTKLKLYNSLTRAKVNTMIDLGQIVINFFFDVRMNLFL